MTSIKDKLASSVRQAKSAAPAKSATPRAADKGAKQTSPPPRPARPAAPPARILDAETKFEPASSSQVLFPDRVWPD